MTLSLFVIQMLNGLQLGVLLFMFMHTSAMMPMSEAAMAHLVTQDGVFNARRYGRVRLWGSLGFLVTVVVAGAFFERDGMRHFPAWTVATMLAVTVSVFMLPNLKEAIPEHAQETSVMPVLRQREVQWFFASVFFHVLSHIGIYAFFSLYLDSLGYSKTTIGLLWAVSVTVEIGWFYTQSRWLPMVSLTAWLVLCSAIMAFRMVVTASAASVPWAAPRCHSWLHCGHTMTLVCSSSWQLGHSLTGATLTLSPLPPFFFTRIWSMGPWRSTLPAKSSTKQFSLPSDRRIPRPAICT